MNNTKISFKDGLNAIYSNDIDKLQNLIKEGLSLNEKDRDGRVLLFHAVPKEGDSRISA